MDPPVPIPNTEVKRTSADDTALATEWENRSLPGGISTQCPLPGYGIISIKNFYLAPKLSLPLT